MKAIIVMTIGVFVAASPAFAQRPAVEREFEDVASRGCKNRDGAFIVRALVSSANDDTLVLADPLDTRNTISATLPGRGPLARVKNAFSKGNEASAERLNDLRAQRSMVTVTLECKRAGAPMVRDISFRDSGGAQAAISF